MSHNNSITTRALLVSFSTFFHVSNQLAKTVSAKMRMSVLCAKNTD